MNSNTHQRRRRLTATSSISIVFVWTMAQETRIPPSNNLPRFMKPTSGRVNSSIASRLIITPVLSSLFTLDKSQCRGVDLQAKQIPTNPYDEKSGVLLKGDNLGRMLALRSGTNMSNVERMADDMITYGLVRFGTSSRSRIGSISLLASRRRL